MSVILLARWGRTKSSSRFFLIAGQSCSTRFLNFLSSSDSYPSKTTRLDLLKRRWHVYTIFWWLIRLVPWCFVNAASGLIINRRRRVKSLSAPKQYGQKAQFLLPFQPGKGLLQNQCLGLLKAFFRILKKAFNRAKHQQKCALCPFELYSYTCRSIEKFRRWEHFVGA